jgi:hypothetical protein
VGRPGAAAFLVDAFAYKSVSNVGQRKTADSESILKGGNRIIKLAMMVDKGSLITQRKLGNHTGNHGHSGSRLPAEDVLQVPRLEVCCREQCG